MTMNGECRTYRDLMDSYISGELTVESNHELLRHAERCEACRGELERRERTRALLIESFGAAPDAAAVTARIAQALDREQDRRTSIGSMARWGSLAAALVLIAGASVWFSRPVDAAAFDDSVDDHIACALTYPPETTYDANRAAQNLEPSYQRIVTAVSHRSGRYELIDAHMCPYQGRNYAHLVYRGDGHVLSVFAEASTRGRLPLTHETPRKGFVTEGESGGGHHVFVVSDGAVRAPDSVVNDLMRATLAYTKSLER
jgi:anti-sigma factor RsiW